MAALRSLITACLVALISAGNLLHQRQLPPDVVYHYQVLPGEKTVDQAVAMTAAAEEAALHAQQEAMNVDLEHKASLSKASAATARLSAAQHLQQASVASFSAVLAADKAERIMNRVALIAQDTQKLMAELPLRAKKAALRAASDVEGEAIARMQGEVLAVIGQAPAPQASYWNPAPGPAPAPGPGPAPAPGPGPFGAFAPQPYKLPGGGWSMPPPPGFGQPGFVAGAVPPPGFPANFPAAAGAMPGQLAPPGAMPPPPGAMPPPGLR